MAIHAHSTTAPARRLLPLTAPRPELPTSPLLDRRAIAADGWARAREMAKTYGGTPRDYLAAGQRLAWSAARRMPPDVAGSKLHAALQAIQARRDAAAVVRREIEALISTAEVEVAERQARDARGLHLRRQLEAAAEQGADLLSALGLPRLVGPGFVQVDPAAAGDALEGVIAALDALDGDPDAESSLGWTGAAIGAAVMGDTLDREAEDLDEPCLGWGAGAQLRLTANEDDGFDALDCGEAVNEDGDDLDRGEHDTADDEAWLGWPEDVRAEAHPLAALSEVDAEHDPTDLGAQPTPWRGGAAPAAGAAYA